MRSMRESEIGGWGEKGLGIWGNKGKGTETKTCMRWGEGLGKNLTEKSLGHISVGLRANMENRVSASDLSLWFGHCALETGGCVQNLTLRDHTD